MDVECMWSGSVHDAKVFANSSINIKLRTNKLPSVFQTSVFINAKIPNCLIGDPAYPLVTFCMKEYDCCTSNELVIFNSMLLSARNQIECAFRRLKARWSILTRKIDFKLERIPTIVHACFVLHNFCEKENIYIGEEAVDNQLLYVEQNEAQFKTVPDPVYSFDGGEGQLVRRTLAQLIKNNI